MGFIISAKKHPDADSLYVEEVDLGEEKPRTIVSGLVKHIPEEQVTQHICNLYSKGCIHTFLLYHLPFSDRLYFLRLTAKQVKNIYIIRGES